MGIETILLDMSIPFTAARARNAGAERILETALDVQFIQFLDGDCTLSPEWLGIALAKSQANPRVGVFCGRRREMFPTASTYNQLCDMEWDTPIGETKACGGDAFIRVETFKQVGGYNEALIAGEEPEMCLRIRQKGWSILRIDEEMTAHDAQMTHFSQWWTRNVRAGHAYAEGYMMYFGAKEALWKHDVRSTLLWAFIAPLVTLLFLMPSHGYSLLLLLGYFWLYNRIVRHRLAHGNIPADAKLYARYCILAKVPQFVGILRYCINRVSKQRSHLIEYKRAPSD